MVSFGAFFVVVLVAAASVAAEGDDVVVLTTASFDGVLKQNKFVLVEFFAPWCGHCKSLAPEYAKAATALKAHGVVLGSVDATVESKLAQDHGVKGYPTLKFFVDGVPQEYTGGRTEPKIVKWVLKTIDAPLQQISDPAALQAFISSNKVTVVGFFDSSDTAALAAFKKVNADENDLVFVVSDNAEAAQIAGASIPSVVVFKAFDTGKAVFTGSLTAEAIAEFVSMEKSPIVIPFTMEVAGDIFQSKIKQIAFLFSEAPLPGFTEIAQKFRGKFVFSTSDGSIQRLNDHVGISKDNLPEFIILSIGNQMQRFPLEGDVTAATIEQHLEAFLKGTLKPTFKSEAVPTTNDGPVKTVVGSTFDSIVMDPTKNVLLEVYAPWCGHCKSLAPVWEQLGEAVKDQSNIVVAKMDGTLNEVDGLSWRSFPTLKFFPAGATKAREGVDYQGGRDLESLKSYVLQQAGSSTGAESHQEL